MDITEAQRQEAIKICDAMQATLARIAECFAEAARIGQEAKEKEAANG